MSKIKAVVLEKSGNTYTVLGENGTFRHVHRRKNAEVGEEIEIQTGYKGFVGLRAWAGIAAMFLMVLTTIFGWNLYQAPTAVALLSVDINPSIQFTIDDQGYVLNIDAQNEDAENLLNKIDLKRKPIGKILGQIVTEAYNQQFLNPERPWVVVGFSPLANESLEKVAEDLNENQIVSWLTENVEEKGFTPQVEFFTLTPQDRELAQKGDLTLGEYALWQTAVKAGVATQPEKLRDTSERVRLLENAKVQAQVKENKKELKSPSSPFKEQIPDDKAKDKGAESNQQKTDQKNKSEKEIEDDKDKDKNQKNKDKEANQRKEAEKKIKEEKEEKNGREPEKNQVQIKTSDKAQNNPVKVPYLSGKEKLPPLTSQYKSSQKDTNINYYPLRWGNLRF